MKSLLILILCFPVTLFAKTIFEPTLSANTGSFKGDITGADDITNGSEIVANYSTLSAGFRYGITRRYVHVTAVAEMHMVNLSASSQTVGNLNTLVDSGLDFQGNFGLGIGYEWNIPLRTYVVLGFPFSGLELSYYFNDTLLVGLKYNQMKFDFNGADLSVNTFGVTVSFPIEFEYPEHWWRKTDWQ